MTMSRADKREIELFLHALAASKDFRLSNYRILQVSCVPSQINLLHWLCLHLYSVSNL